MIQKGTYLNVVDNSGIKQIGCLHIVGGYRKRYAKFGELILASIKSLRIKQNIKLKKGNIVKALIVRTKVFHKSANSSTLFFRNSAVLLTNQNKFYGNKIFGAISKEFRKTKYLKLLSLASGIIK